MRENWQGLCWHCGHRLEAQDYGRENRCPECNKATHCCRNCSYYKPGIANDCREPVAEHVADKERPNFCDYFEPANNFIGSDDQSAADDLLEAAEDLFK